MCEKNIIPPLRVAAAMSAGTWPPSLESFLEAEFLEIIRCLDRLGVFFYFACIGQKHSGRGENSAF